MIDGTEKPFFSNCETRWRSNEFGRKRLGAIDRLVSNFCHIFLIAAAVCKSEI